MRKKKITYGINGLMTYQAVFQSGLAKVKVMFTDGSITATGKRPATFTTDSLMMQHIIENSPEFKKGFIFRYRNLVLNEEVEVERNPPRVSCEIPEEGHCHTHHGHKPKETEAEVEECDDLDLPLGEREHIEEGEGDDEEFALSAHTDSEELPLEEPEPVGEPEAAVVFKFNDEAKDFLEAEFGVERSKLRNREDIKKAGEENGVTIVFE